jgi:multidrug resistance efflux pump
MNGKQAFKLTIVLLAILAFAGLTACSQSSPAASPTTSNNPSIPGSPGPSGQPTRTVPAGLSFPKPTTTPQAAPLITNPANLLKGSGNINIALDANLNFDTGGKISQLKVKKGDRITKGSLLAALDTTNLSVAVSQARVTLDQAILSKKNAELALETANFNLEKTLAVSKIKDVIMGLQWQIKVAQTNVQDAAVSEGNKSSEYWIKIMQGYQNDLAAETKILQDMMKDPVYSSAVTYDIVGQAYDRLTVQDIRMKTLQIEAAQITYDRAQDVIDQAQKSLDQAQRQFNGATIFAPFDGMVITVNYKEGEIAPTPSPSQKPIIYLVDPNSMQIVVVINELDIPRVKIGQSAVVKVDAFPSAKIEGKVTDISIIPNVQGGTVNYDVTVSFNVPSDVGIRSGMNAVAEITTS